MTNAVVIVSGGMDSAVLLTHVVKYLKDSNSAGKALALSFNYGQRHNKELTYAAQFCANLEVPHKIADVSSINGLIQGSALTSPDVEVPHGHYAADNMKITVVPNRNAIMLSLAVGYALSNQADCVYFGAHGGDHAIYPDCREAFVGAFSNAMKLGNWEDIEVIAPFVNMTKTDICREGLVMGVDFAHTWSCYQGSERPCLKCGTCQERTIAFRDNSTKDPLLTDQEWEEALKIVEGVS